MDCKYLSDGRKVVVIGTLNDKESIVQEIFITKDGDEVPGGERFTTKSLHDEPVVSYQSREKKRAEDDLAKIKTAIEYVENKKRAADHQLKAMSLALAAQTKLFKNIPDAQLDTFNMFLTGSIEYVVLDNWCITAPEKYIDAITSKDGWADSVDGLKLLTVMGSSDGDLTYRINRYHDGSGSNTKISFFSSLADALLHVEEQAVEKIDAGRFTFRDLQACADMGVNFHYRQRQKLKKAFKASAKTAEKELRAKYEQETAKALSDSEKAMKLLEKPA